MRMANACPVRVYPKYALFQKGSPMAPSIFGPGPHLNDLMDRLADMGAPACEWWRVKGANRVQLIAYLPDGQHDVESSTLDEAARNMIVLALTSGDQETHDAKATA